MPARGHFFRTAKQGQQLAGRGLGVPDDVVRHGGAQHRHTVHAALVSQHMASAIGWLMNDWRQIPIGV